LILVITLLQLSSVCPAQYCDMLMCPCMSIALRIREMGCVSRYGDKVWGWISSRIRSSSSAKRSHLLWTPSSFLVRGIQGSFPGVEWPGRKADLSPSSSAKVTNEWSCTSAPPICLHGVDRDVFTFQFVLPNLPLTFDRSFDAVRPLQLRRHHFDDWW